MGRDRYARDVRARAPTTPGIAVFTQREDDATAEGNRDEPVDECTVTQLPVVIPPPAVCLPTGGHAAHERNARPDGREEQSARVRISPALRDEARSSVI